MVALQIIRDSNARVKTSLGAGLVAVFVGATSGIGETSLREFARYTTSPRVYFLGRSEEAGARITAECKQLNPQGTFTFIPSDLSLIRNVDSICRDIKAKEKHINILWMSQGSLIQGIKTGEGMNMSVSLMHFSRVRFMMNLLPLLRAAPGIKRVVSCLAGTKEGQINFDDFQGWNVPTSQVHSYRGHIASAATFAMEHLAKQAPEVSFIHDIPGLVRSGIARGQESSMWRLRFMLYVMYPLAATNTQESGERHLYLMTSAKYPAGSEQGTYEGIPIDGTLRQAEDTHGNIGGGVYSVDRDLENQNAKALQVMNQLRHERAVEKVWEATQQEFVRIAGA